MILSILVTTFLVQVVCAAATSPWRRRCETLPEDVISLQLYTVRDAMDADAPAILAAVADAGFRHVEPFSLHGHERGQFADLLAAAGLTASALHMDMDTLTGNLEGAIADAKAIGADTVFLGWTPPEWRTDEGRVAELAALFDEAGRTLRDEGLRMGYHNHDFDFSTVFEDGRSVFDVLVAETDPELVTFELDVYWVAEAGLDPVDVIQQYGDRISMLHVKDRSTSGEFADVGEGTLDFERIFATQPFSYYVVENDQPDDQIQSINDGHTNIRQICYDTS